MINVEVCNEQSALEVDAELFRQAVATVLKGESVSTATISIAVVDGTTMRELNARYLNHDYDTDVLSFLLDESDERLEGEIIVSADTAITQAQQFGWPAGDEMLVYVIHGTLHLTGYDDHADEDRGLMRLKEMHYLTALGMNPLRADPFGESRLAADPHELHDQQEEG